MFYTRYDVGSIKHPGWRAAEKNPGAYQYDRERGEWVLKSVPATSARVRLLTVWEACDGRNARRPSVSLQLAVVQYCTDVPGTPVPTLDDMEAVRALVGSLRRYRARPKDSDVFPWGVWDDVTDRFANVCLSFTTAAQAARDMNARNV
ncbi:hypothetical protein [Streptomyces sp. NPDC058252]|uniref:hypothetical protein n=1 Tax=Streptomyces sp. NPDC058252 TaxID=3346405 RepID=UPI0036E9EE86